MKVLVTGASGFVGRVVVEQLLAEKHQVVVLTRNIAKAALVLGSQCEFFQWADTMTPPAAECFNEVDAVINLMGEGVADKCWSNEQKAKIYNSRVLGTKSLITTIAQLPQKPKAFVSASAVGIYGDRGEEEIKEDATFGKDFLAGVCKDWEEEATVAKTLGMRTSIIRIGVVLGHGGGALAKMIPVFKFGFGGPLGSGKQYMSWIHIQDLAAMFVAAATNEEFSGVYNGTAPYPAQNVEFSKALGRELKRPACMPAPAFAMEAMLGEMSEMLLGGQKVYPARMQDAKFHYRYPTLEMALKETAY